MKKSLHYFLLITALWTMASCASIIKGTKQTVHIASEPPGATIEINGVPHGTTPADIEVNKSMNVTPIVLKKPGYEDAAFKPSTSFDPIAILNLFGFLGWGVDYLTGALMQYSPTTYTITLTPSKK